MFSWVYVYYKLLLFKVCKSYDRQGNRNKCCSIGFEYILENAYLWRTNV